MTVPACMIIIDGAALVYILKPAMSETFDDYASMYMEHIRRQFISSVCRVDIVIDMYTTDSLKIITQRKRGNGTRRRVEGLKKSSAS